GDDSLTLPLLSVGGTGVVSVASHLVGDLLQQMVVAFEQGQVKTATQLHLRLLPLFKALFLTANPIPVKVALGLQGWQVGASRLPLWCTTEDLHDLRQTLSTVLETLDLLPVTV
ncbi:MAG: dihydrodipicolinate synthase family protein, partial [Cyanobacteria bacterium J06659_2]